MAETKAKLRAIQVGDQITIWAYGYLRQVTVVKVTFTYIWVEFTSPSTRHYHRSKYRRDQALMGTPFF